MNMHAIVKELNEFKAEFQKKAKSVLSKEIKEFFVKVPEISRIVWVQYSPYFNDGDECVFSVNDPCFHAENLDFLEEDVKKKYQKYLDDEDEDCYYDITYAIRDCTNLKTYSNPSNRDATETEVRIFSACNELTSLLTGLNESMKEMFGNHVKVTATAEGFDVDEYEHD